MKVGQAIGITIIIVLGFVLMLMWVNAIELEQEREETQQMLERHQRFQADKLYSIEKEQRRLDKALRDAQAQREFDKVWGDRGR